VRARRNLRLLAAALTALGTLVVGLVSVAGASTGTRVNQADHGPSWQGLRTVTYQTADGIGLLMSLFAPLHDDHPVAVVLEVHGGGWQHGHRLLSLTDSDTATDLVTAGFMVASIDYRLAPLHPWPDQMIDVVSAVRYLRAHAAELGLDPDRIAAMGDSAGGQLVSLLGTAPDQARWSQGPDAATSARVDAVVDEFGPSNLSADNWPRATAEMIHTVFGAFPTSGDPTLKAASPLTYAAAGDPPFLIVQGTRDGVVPESQSVALAARLRAAGDPVDLMLVDRGGHGLATPGEYPAPAAISSIITAFLVKKVEQR